MSHLKLFIKPGCPWCMQATAWLTNEGYRYQEVDVITDDAAFDEMKSLSGQTFAPTLLLETEDGDENDGAPESGGDEGKSKGKGEGGVAGKDGANRKILADFDVDELKQFFKAEGVKPPKS